MDRENGRVAYVARHGETSFNSGSAKYNGRRTQSQLNENGWQDARDLANWFFERGIHIDRLLGSTLDRSRDTALEIHSINNTPLLEARSELDEIDFGDFDGRDVGEVKSESPEFFAVREQSNETKAHTVYPNGESLAMVQVRVSPVTEEVRGGKEEVVVFVGHQLANQAIIAGLTGTPIEEMVVYRQKHREIVEVDLETGSWKVHTLDED